MSTNPLRLPPMLGALALLALLAGPAHASLGGAADSVAADSEVLHGQLRSTAFVNYDVREIDVGALTVREYLTRAGQVFAVTWQGPTLPDLRQLLGGYFGRFQAAAASAHQSNPGIHRQLLVSQPDLVVASVGRLRDFHGFAYLPALLPAGVSVDDLQ